MINLILKNVSKYKHNQSAQADPISRGLSPAGAWAGGVAIR
jgi:hypothetical protein